MKVAGVAVCCVILKATMLEIKACNDNNSDATTGNETYDIYNPLENSTYNETYFFGPEYHRTSRIVILVFMICFSLVGNLVVCLNLITVRSRRYSKSKLLFLNLAFADLLVTLVTMTSQLVWEVIDKLWFAGDAFCRVFKFTQTFSLASSTYMLVSIAADRHRAIVRPMSRWLTPKSLATGAWLASIVPSVPCLAIFQVVRTSKDTAYCTSLFYTGKYPLYYRQMYMASVIAAVFILPAFLLIGLYSGILVKIWSQSSVFTRKEQSGSALPRAKVKTLKMTVVIFLTFVVTNVPYFVQEMILAFAPYSNILDPNTVALFGVISASNSAFNPYIYMSFQAKHPLRTMVCKAFPCLSCCENQATRDSNAEGLLPAQTVFSTSRSSKRRAAVSESCSCGVLEVN